MSTSSETFDNALYSYALSELHSVSWQHVLYGEVTQLTGARLVLAPGAMVQGITPPQDKVCKEYLTELEAFPREATGLAFVNFSIKEYERPPACGGLAVIGAQRVIGKKDHSGRPGPIWKHAVYTSAGPNKRAPIQLDPRTLSEAARRMKDCLSAKDRSGRLTLADEFSRFQDAADEKNAETVLIEHLRRLDHLPEAPSDVGLPNFRVRREGDEARGVLYIRYDDRYVTIEQIIPQAAKIAAILYYSDFPWLAVELQCDDRQRQRGSLPGWVVRFVGKDAQLTNSSGRIETYERLFNVERSDREEESLSALAGRFFAALGGQFEPPSRDVSQPYPSGRSPTAPRPLNERGPQTILTATPTSLTGKPPATDKLTQGGAERRPLSDSPTEFHSKSANTPTQHTPLATRAGEQRSPSSAPTPASSPWIMEGSVNSSLSDLSPMLARPPVVPVNEEHLGQAIATNRNVALMGSRPLLGFIPERVKLVVTLIWATVIFIAALLSLLDRARAGFALLSPGISAEGSDPPHGQVSANGPPAPVQPLVPKPTNGRIQAGPDGGTQPGGLNKGSNSSSNNTGGSDTAKKGKNNKQVDRKAATNSPTGNPGAPSLTAGGQIPATASPEPSPQPPAANTSVFSVPTTDVKSVGVQDKKADR